jgi:hypothetical protein
MQVQNVILSDPQSTQNFHMREITPAHGKDRTSTASCREQDGFCKEVWQVADHQIP